METTSIGFGFKPSIYQRKIFDWSLSHLGKGEHLQVIAVAGSGKSKTGIELFKLLPDNLNSQFVAFARNAADNLASKLPKGNASTYHSLGYQTLKKTYGSVDIQERKVEFFLKKNYPTDRWLYYVVQKLVGLCKGYPKFEFTELDLRRIAFDHDLDLYEKKGDEIPSRIFEMVWSSLEYSKSHPRVVDFDDMIWLPNVLNRVSFYQYDFLFVDEAQDTNVCQGNLAVNSINSTGMIIVVGDPNQSIFRFRGADETAMGRLKELLDAHSLPLSVSYRCPLAVCDLVNKKWPEIPFESPEWAKQGAVNDILSKELLKKIQVDDLVLCRVNAELVPVAFALIRDGIKATIKGRKIGDGLKALIKKSGASEVTPFLTWLAQWESDEMAKAVALEKKDKIQLITDKVETMSAMCEGTEDLGEVARRCEELFSDERKGVLLSTVHRAKGDEAPNVFIIRPDLIPHPMAKKIEDKNQERNLEYVAVTRAMETLNFVR